MARNLQAKLPPGDSISIFDINKTAVESLKAEMHKSSPGGASVQIAGSAAEASSEAVSPQIMPNLL
jgi:3-hydroxyisobutyrate/3-hydroxypropionate dehydrogenase